LHLSQAHDQSTVEGNMSPTTDIEKYRSFLEDETNSAALYQVLAEAQKDPRLAEVYRRLAATERGHAQVWEKKLRDAGVEPGPIKVAPRTRLLAWLAQRFGAQAVLPMMMSMEAKGTNDYAGQPGAGSMAAAEHSHARLLRTLGGAKGGGLEGAALAQIEGRHRSAGGNALRAAVLGANDGLVSNFSLVMGVAGADLSPSTILLTGLAGLLAGAISMALGEWISVQSSRELYQRQIAIETEEIEQAPEEETEELSLIYQARGMDESAARQLAGQVMSNQQGALQALSREELGIDPDELGGSAWEAAITSFFLFAAGAIIPVIPYLFLSGLQAVALSAALSALGLFVIGAAITLFTGRSVLSSGLRQAFFGLVAALVTYLIGRLIGVSVAG
jgi:VIT1/CCC1 family predicted Fe2+/Mn2+ transporter